MTRDSDTGLYKETDSHKNSGPKSPLPADQRHLSRPDISIHQNSYHEEAINGGQVFYYKTSEKENAWQRRSPETI